MIRTKYNVDGVSVPFNFQNIKGQKLSRLSVISLTRDPSGKLYWLCNCECGKEKKCSHVSLIKGKSKSCGCLNKEICISRSTVHGMAGTPEYFAWKRIKSRTTNSKNPDYLIYSHLGMEEEWKNDFLKFLTDIGPKPKDDKSYSVDRKDNSKGYFTGNVRWATDDQQSKNKGKYSSNKTGVTGVYVSGNRYIANWYDLKGKQKSKGFNMDKLGEELSFFMACEYRDQMITLLNLQGAGYSETHGV